MDKLVLVEEFSNALAGSGKDRDITRWSQFTDASHNRAETLKPLDDDFEKWLNPE